MTFGETGFAAPPPLQTRVYDNPFIQANAAPGFNTDPSSLDFQYATPQRQVGFDFGEAALADRASRAPAPEGLGMKTNISPAMQTTMAGMGLGAAGLNLGATLAKTATPAAAGTAATLFGSAGIIPGIGTAIAGIGTIASGIANWYYASKQMKAQQKAEARSQAIQDRAIAEEQKRYETSLKMQKRATTFQEEQLLRQSSREEQAQLFQQGVTKETLKMQKTAQAEAVKQNRLATAIQLMAGTTKFFNTPQGRLQFAQIWR